MTTMTVSQIDAIRDRNPEAFRQPLLKRFAMPLGVLVCALYTVYCFWFFSIGTVFAQGNWGIAGSYLADWVSYEVRPDVDYRTGEIVVEYPRFSPLGPDPDPAWMQTEMGTVTVRSQRRIAPAENAPSPADSFMSPSSPATSTGSADSADTSAGDDNASSFDFMAPQSSATNTGTSGGTDGVEQTETVTETRQGIAVATIVYTNAARIEATPQQVTVMRDGQTLVLAVDAREGKVTPQGDLPKWAVQKRENAKVFIDFGFSGRAEVRSREIKINKRFWGWENFWFDPSSPYWGKSFPEVVSLAFSGERIDEQKSNMAVLWNSFVNNAEWQHGDVWIKLLQTIVMAFVGTLFACIVAFPLSFMAARNITPHRFLNQFLKRFFDFLRSVDMLIWALFFTRAFGPGPLAGISAIFFTDTGTFGKLYSEALENIDDKQREGVRSVGASPAAVQRFGVVPQVLPIFASQALYFWESNTRSATIIGAVGAGGIGLKLWEAMRTNQDWENVAYMVILILLVVFVFDGISNALRSRLIGRTA